MGFSKSQLSPIGTDTAGNPYYFDLRGRSSGAPSGGGARGETQGIFSLPSYDSGGWVTRDGPIFAHAGEYVVPKGSTNSFGDIHVHGNVDSENTARRMADRVVELAFRKLQQSTGRQTLTKR